MKPTITISDRKLRAAFLERCYDESLDPGEVLEAWLRRAVRQERTVRPINAVAAQVVAMRRR